MRIGELSERTGASIRSLRYYEKKGLISSERLRNGYRDFDEEQIERVRDVQFYLSLGLSTDHIEGSLNCKGRDAPPVKDPEINEQCEELLVLYEEKLSETDEQMQSLSEARSRLRERIALFQEHMEEARSRTPR
ncbi:MAG: MerR family transcriptional regulator [Actinomycetota bacterium]|nr:MerR family transcriptional regulator [Actinomycetota bacterium]MDQ3496326.1 MerR family transcriptional regulator [Actinomycetota bacterium]